MTVPAARCGRELLLSHRGEGAGGTHDRGVACLHACRYGRIYCTGGLYSTYGMFVTVKGCGGVATALFVGGRRGNGRKSWVLLELYSTVQRTVHDGGDADNGRPPTGTCTLIWRAHLQVPSWARPSPSPPEGAAQGRSPIQTCLGKQQLLAAPPYPHPPTRAPTPV